MIGMLCEAYGALPLPGGVLAQPLRLLLLGKTLREYAQAYALYQRDPKDAPDEVRSLVLRVAAMSVGAA